MDLKQQVKSYWQEKVCGAVYGMDDRQASVDLDRMAAERYRLEPYILPFADFPSARGRRVLEVGVGGGTDFSNWVRHGAIATGIDLTEAGIGMTRQRLTELGLPDDSYELRVGDAENLAFPANTFDIVYSYGVLHHSPDTGRAFQEVCRVLKPGGVFKGMIYHSRSWVALMFYLRWSLLAGKPFKSPRQAVYEHLESPGTKVYSVNEARQMLSAAGFSEIKVWTQLSFGDLLLIKSRGRYRSWPYRLVWKLYPRWLVRLLGDRWGTILFLVARK